jgi:hypothetical protein
MLEMWTDVTRGRMAEIERRTGRYPTDLTDEEWARIAPLLPGPRGTGRRRETDLREVLNAVRCLVRIGCGWRMLPKDFAELPPVSPGQSGMIMEGPSLCLGTCLCKMRTDPASR